jgi:hypothetical protein
VGRDNPRYDSSEAPIGAWGSPADSPQNWFADEIAIDFPSVHHAIERMRETFFSGVGAGEEGDLVATELSLSRQEAWDGLVVALELPMRAMCPACGGRGETWTEPCRPCGGSGASIIQHGVRLSVPPGVPNGARLRFRVSSPQVASVRVEVRVAIRPSGW